MPNLDIVLNNKDNCYNRNIHYKTFYTTTPNIGESSAYKKCLYLTYKGRPLCGQHHGAATALRP